MREYRKESKLRRDNRLRKFLYHDLLGLLDVTVLIIHKPQWRYHTTIDILPWLSHRFAERQVIWLETDTCTWPSRRSSNYPSCEISQAYYPLHIIHPAVLDAPNNVMGTMFIYRECVKAADNPSTSNEPYRPLLA